MQGTRHSSISHRNLPYCHALSEEKFDEAISKLRLKRGDRAIDFGGGKGEFIIRLIKRFKVRGIVVERPDSLGTEVVQRAKGRIPLRNLQVDLRGTREFLEAYEGERFDLSASIHSISLGSDYRDVLDILGKVTKPGGSIVIGMAYWKTKPPRNLKVGFPHSHMCTYTEFFKAIKKRGMNPIWASVASEDESDRYAWTLASEIENYVIENPRDPDAKTLLKEARDALQFYVEILRDYYGFAFFVVQNHMK